MPEPEPEPSVASSVEAERPSGSVLPADPRLRMQEAVGGSARPGPGPPSVQPPRIPTPSTKSMPPPRMQVVYPYYAGVDPYQRGYPVVQGQPVAAGLPMRTSPSEQSYSDPPGQRFPVTMPSQQPPSMVPRFQLQPHSQPAASGMGMAPKGMQHLSVPTPPSSAAQTSTQTSPSRTLAVPQGISSSIPAGDDRSPHRPKLTVQIPGSGIESEQTQQGAVGDGSAQGEKTNGRSTASIVSATAARWPTAFPQSPMQFFVAPQPTDSASARDQAAASKTSRRSSGSLAGQTGAAETPTTALPSRYISDMLASPSNMFSMEPDVLHFTPISERKRVASGGGEPDAKRAA